MNRTTAATLAATFLGCILAANYVTTEYGMIPVGFGLVATAGTYLAVQDAGGKRWALGVVVVGASSRPKRRTSRRPRMRAR